MGRKRKHDKHLLQRVYHRGKSYYLVDHTGRWIRLGRSVAEMYRNFAAILEDKPIVTMKDLFDRYMIEVVPTKSERTQRDDAYEMRFLRAALNHMIPAEFKPRRRYVTESEYQAAYRAMPVMVQCAMDLAVLTGLRPGDLLALERDNITDDGLEVATRKTGKRLLIEWSAELRRVVKRALKQPPRMRRPIICNKQGNAYTVDGFNSNWYRAIRAAIADPENPLAEPFQFRDLRAKSASDDTAEAASKRLGHADPGITERVYRRKPARARPLR